VGIDVVARFFSTDYGAKDQENVSLPLSRGDQIQTIQTKRKTGEVTRGTPYGVLSTTGIGTKKAIFITLRSWGRMKRYAYVESVNGWEGQPIDKGLRSPQVGFLIEREKFEKKKTQGREDLG